MGRNSEDRRSIEATVKGEQLQRVGFRAMVMKNAIMFNLAGSATNQADGPVNVVLQGDPEGIDETLEAMRAGSKKSSQGNTVTVAETAWDDNLRTFTIVAWTSASRNITTAYDLVFKLRPDDEPISHHDAKAAWNDIALNTLKGDDRQKFLDHLQQNDE